MSLSKYYSGSENFQAEKLVREAEADKQFRPQESGEPPPFSPSPIVSRSAVPSAASRPLPSPFAESGQADTDGFQGNISQSDIFAGPSSAAPLDTPFDTDPAARLAEDDGYSSQNQQEMTQGEGSQNFGGQYIDIEEFKRQAEEQAAAAYRQGVEDGREAGLQEGVRQGMQQGMEQAAQHKEDDYLAAASALNNACTQINSLQETLMRNSSGEIIELTLAIAERILRFSVAEQDKTIVAVIEESLQRAIRSEEFTISLNPADYETVAAKSKEIIANISGLENIVLKSSPEIERGGAKLESGNCSIDATVASQFDIICREIRKKG